MNYPTQEQWTIVSDELTMAKRELNAAEDRYMRACLARIVLVHQGFPVSSLPVRGPEP